MSKAPSAKSGVRSTLVARKAVRTSVRRLAPVGRANFNLPSGESLAEFALRFGFLAPALLGSKIVQIPLPPGFREVR